MRSLFYVAQFRTLHLEILEISFKVEKENGLSVSLHGLGSVTDKMVARVLTGL